MKYSFAVLITFFFSLSSIAQNSKTISGMARDIQNMPVAGATVSLMNSKDSIVVSTKVTGDNGKFEFNNLKNGEYIFNITFISFKKYQSVVLVINEQHPGIVSPVIILQPEKNVSLKEVIVKTKRPLLVQDIDKTIVNVDAMTSSATSNALEVLEKTPGVLVSNNGDIILNGKSGVTVLIDGRATYMSGSDLAAYLKSLPGNLLDKIELMDNPPAKYDAAGNAIINIRLKRNRAAGYTGNLSVAYSQGIYSRHSETINLNYNQKKVSLFGNFSYNDETNYSDDVYNRKFYAENKLIHSSVSLQNFQKSISKGVSARVGMDWLPSQKTTYGFILNINNGPREGFLNYYSNSFNAANTPDSNGIGNTLTNDKRRNLGANLNYLHKFNNSGREISADLNYLNYQSEASQLLKSSNYMPDGTLNSRNTFYYNLPSNINIYTFKADYTHPLKNGAGWEAGVKSSIVNNDNNAEYFNTNGNTNTPDYGRSNHFIYDENINAAYVNTRKSWKRFGAQLGFRVENTMITGKQLGNSSVAGSAFTKNYTNGFPTTFISYKLDSTGLNTLVASLSRRISRPNYQLFNPFLFYRDNYSYTSGNPLLSPQYQYQAQLKYQHKQWLGISLQYGQFKNVIFQTTEAVNNIFITRPGNISSGFMAILSTNVLLNPAKWWTINTNVMIAHMELHGMAYSEKLNPGANTARVNILNQFNFNKDWSAELTGFYSGKDIQGQTINEPKYRVFAAAQKKIWKDKAAIKIIAEDIFHSWIQKDNSVNIKQAESFHTNETDSRRVGVAFTFRFGKDNTNRKSRHVDNAADAEKGRVD